MKTTRVIFSISLMLGMGAYLFAANIKPNPTMARRTPAPNKLDEASTVRSHESTTATKSDQAEENARSAPAKLRSVEASQRLQAKKLLQRILDQKRAGHADSEAVRQYLVLENSLRSKPTNQAK